MDITWNLIYLLVSNILILSCWKSKSTLLYINHFHQTPWVCFYFVYTRPFFTVRLVYLLKINVKYFLFRFSSIYWMAHLVWNSQTLTLCALHDQIHYFDLCNYSFGASWLSTNILVIWCTCALAFIHYSSSHSSIQVCLQPIIIYIYLAHLSLISFLHRFAIADCTYMTKERKEWDDWNKLRIIFCFEQIF